MLAYILFTLPFVSLGRGVQLVNTNAILATYGDDKPPLHFDVAGAPLLYMAIESVLFLGVLVYVDTLKMRNASLFSDPKVAASAATFEEDEDVKA